MPAKPHICGRRGCKNLTTGKHCAGCYKADRKAKATKRECVRCGGRICHNNRSKICRNCKPPNQLNTERDHSETLRRMLRRHAMSYGDIARYFRISRVEAEYLCETLRDAGANIVEIGSLLSIEKTPGPVESNELHVLESDDDGRYYFGAISDNHYCSKYAREDVSEDLYDTFAAEGITKVFNGGNMIDGEASFNRFDLIDRGHGCNAQIQYLVETYPQRRGITTYFIAADDHEGWYAQREGLDVGRMIQNAAERAGRDDLKYLGFMESFITLRHKRTRAEAQMLLTHPGGGSAYAISYAPQKLVESFQGGEKPAVLLCGHWHKLGFENIRNVWTMQIGCCQDQTPFARKKRLDFHVGGARIGLVQDENGAITECWPRFKRYFDRGYYENRWSKSGPVRLPRVS